MKRTILLLCSLATLGAGAAFAADTGAPPKAAATPHERYVAECSSCHMAYPASFLPARSWKKLMGDLGNHFGDNAELSDATRQQITDYLLANAGDRSGDRRGARFAGSAPANETPLRITALPYFKREHREIPQRYIRDNPKVGSLSNCAACHTKAEQGSFREREISIPGVGRWEEDD
jgi:mono/diheme cytochrome c family protein